MQNLNALFYTDLHMFPHGGRFSRVDDAVEALRWVEKVYLEKKCNHLFFLGDWSHNKFMTHNVVIARTREILADWRDKGYRMTFIPGNHDCPHKVDPRDALPYLDEFGHVIRQPFMYFYEDTEVLCVPWAGPFDRTKAVIEASAQALKGHERHDSMRSTLFLGHLDLVGAQMTNHERAKSGLDPAFLGSHFDLSLLGHYHIFNTVTPQVWYIGSLISTRFDEEGTRGVVRFEGGGAEVIPNQISPIHLKLRATEVTSERCKNNYLRIYTGPADDPGELRRLALEMGARTVRCLPDVAFSVDDFKELSDEALHRPAGQLTDEELLDAWVDHSAPDTLDKGELREHGWRILRKAREDATTKGQT